jgi:hypothetical protein
MAEDDEGAKKAEVIDPTDVLNDWLVTRVVSTFRCPREKAVGMCNNEASRAAIETFYGKDDVQRLVVTMNPDPTAVRARGEATRGARSPPASPLDAIAKIETLGASTPPGVPRRRAATDRSARRRSRASTLASAPRAQPPIPHSASPRARH